MTSAYILYWNLPNKIHRSTSSFSRPDRINKGKKKRRIFFICERKRNTLPVRWRNLGVI